MWLSKDKDDNRIWVHPYSKPVLHTYTDYKGIEHKRYVTESQYEIDLSTINDDNIIRMISELTYENSPKELIIK